MFAHRNITSKWFANKLPFLMFVHVDMDGRESRVLYSSKLSLWTVIGWSCSSEDSPKTT